MMILYIHLYDFMLFEMLSIYKY